MSNPLYLSLEQTARQLIATFGRAAVVEEARSVEIDPLTGLPKAGDPTTHACVAIEFDSSMQWGSQVKGPELQSGQSLVYAVVDNGYIVKPGDKVLGLAVVEATRVQPDGDVVILQSLVCRR